MQIVDLLQEDDNLQSTRSEIHDFPQHIKVWSAAKKLEWVLAYVYNVVSKLFIALKKADTADILLHLNLADGHMRGTQVEVQIGGIPYRFMVPVRTTSDELRNSSSCRAFFAQQT